MKLKQVGLFIGLGGIAAAAVVLVQFSQRNADVVLPVAGSSPPSARAGSTSPAVVVGQAIVAADEWRQSVRLFDNAKGMFVHNRERDPSSLQWFEHKVPISWAYPIVNVTSSMPNQFFALGAARNGYFVIERWDIRAPDGAFSAVRPLGGPTQVVLVGGAFQEPSTRKAVVVDREELLRSNSLGELVQICADPDARYVLAITRGAAGSAQALRVDTVTGALTTIADNTTLPALPFVQTLISVSHAGHGLVHVGLPDESPYHISDKIVFIDSDRDGQIDLALQLTDVDFALGGYLISDQWDDRG